MRYFIVERGGGEGFTNLKPDDAKIGAFRHFLPSVSPTMEHVNRGLFKKNLNFKIKKRGREGTKHSLSNRGKKVGTCPPPKCTHAEHINNLLKY